MPSWEVIRRALAVRGPISFGAAGPVLISGAGFPASGTAGVGVGYAPVGSIYADTTRGTMWQNEGTQASPYWVPVSFDQPGMMSLHTDFRDQVGIVITDTGAEFIFPSGVRLFGQGKTSADDSGAVSQAAVEGNLGGAMRVTTTNEALHVIALGSEAGVWQADQHGMAIIDDEVSQISAITLRASGIGMLGLAADALDPPASGATVTTTFDATGNAGDDLAGMFFDVGFSDGDRYNGFHNKSDDADTQLIAALGTGVNVPAAGTFQRRRVEFEPVGSAVIMRCFLDKVLVLTVDDVLDEDEEHSPVSWMESTDAAIKSADFRRWSFVSGQA